MTLSEADLAAGAPATNSRTLLEVADLRVEFALKGSLLRAVDGLSISVESGRTLAIIGESGSGKSVAARAILGLLPEDTATVFGSVKFEGVELVGLPDKRVREFRGRGIGFVPQDPARSLNPTIQVGRQIVEALRVYLPLSKADANARAIELLERVRIPEARHRFSEYPHQLSGGMRQRVVIAMALACGPKLLIADEPTTALDVTTQAQVMRLLLELQSEIGMSLILISHDMAIAASYADEIAVMYAGRVMEQAPTEQLFETVRMPYTRALLDAIPNIERPPHSTLRVVGGLPPNPLALPRGCAFSPRCSSADSICEESKPVLYEHAQNHRVACFHPLVDIG